jgi:flagellar biosynthetic protein FliR
MISFSSADINLWVAGLLWPLTRILALMAAAPLFGNSAVPASVKVSLGTLLALVIAPVVPPQPAADPLAGRLADRGAGNADRAGHGV